MKGRSEGNGFVVHAVAYITGDLIALQNTFIFIYFFEEQLLSVRPVFRIANPSLTTTTAVVVKCLAAGHLLSPC